MSHSPLVLRVCPGGSRREFLRALRDSGAGRNEFIAKLQGAPFAAFRLEFPPFSPATAHRAAEYVIIDSPQLAASRPDPAAFLGNLSEDGVSAFRNLGDDATLVAPPARGAWPHLAAFVRTAPAALVHELVHCCTRTMFELSDSGRDPVWLSTAGLGVPWLHVRLDDRPKYYLHAPWRHPDS